jgi:hypothetical protein
MKLHFTKLTKYCLTQCQLLIKIQHWIIRLYIYNILFLLCVSYGFIKDVVISFSRLYLSSKFLFQLGNPYVSTRIGTSNMFIKPNELHIDTKPSNHNIDTCQHHTHKTLSFNLKFVIVIIY